MKELNKISRAREILEKHIAICIKDKKTLTKSDFARLLMIELPDYYSSFDLARANVRKILGSMSSYGNTLKDNIRVREMYAQMLGTPPPYNAKVNESAPVVIGQKVQSEKRINFHKDVLPYLINLCDHAQRKLNTKLSQSILAPKLPFMVVPMSDIHGGAKTNYRRLYEEINLIKSTPDCFVIIAGDVTDNFIIGKLISVQMHQPTTLEHERMFAEWFVNELKDKIIAWISGNHDNWSYKVAGFDPYKHYLKGVNCLFDRHEVLFDLRCGEYSERWCIRHKWKTGSVFNPTHGMEVGWERNGMDFDVAIGGHTHIATLHREFIKHDIKRSAVLLGTYKILDEYGKESGFANAHSESVGSGAFVYDQEFKRYWFDDVRTGIKFLNFLKQDGKN